jgi:hypothetical protein
LPRGDVESSRADLGDRVRERQHRVGIPNRFLELRVSGVDAFPDIGESL